MRIDDLPEHERPRERLLRLGPAALSDAELLAVLLRTGPPGRSVLDLAGALINRFGGLCALFAADAFEVRAVAGIGPGKFAQLQAGNELARRSLAETWQRGAALLSPHDCEQFLRSWLGAQKSEVFGCLFLDARARVIATEEIARGTIDYTTVHPRDVVRRALVHNAASVVLAHNHPSGHVEPSACDIALTQRLTRALALIDVRVLDHVVIGQGASASFADRGLL